MRMWNVFENTWIINNFTQPNFQEMIRYDTIESQAPIALDTGF